MPIIKIEDIAHVRFAAPDLSTMRSFLEDFGMHCFEESGRLYGKAATGNPSSMLPSRATPNSSQSAFVRKRLPIWKRWLRLKVSRLRI